MIFIDHYQVAQICLNGHCICASVDANPTRSQNFCNICGSKTTRVCLSCGETIHGHYHVDGVCVLGATYHVPAYCHHCGKPYPWTASALEAAKLLIEEEESLSLVEQERMIEVLPDIITETPKSSLAAVRIKKVMATASKFVADALRQFIIDFGCELIKKQLGL